MFLMIILTALAALAVATTIRALRTDGYRQTPTDPARVP